jgi:DNA repair photolyase
MPLKESHGNMYDWVTHMHSHLGGECPHRCYYCYVQRNPRGVSGRYQGEVRLIREELGVNYGTGRTIFIEHMNDMFAEGIKEEWIRDIFGHCNQYKNNIYVFQTKNPNRAYKFIDYFPERFLIGTTIETNRDVKETKAPRPIERFLGIRKFLELDSYKDKANIFITIEPIMDFDVDILFFWILELRPSFVNIGADSKNTGLIEPPPNKIERLIKLLKEKNITIKKKTNLQRLWREFPG